MKSIADKTEAIEYMKQYMRSYQIKRHEVKKARVLVSFKKKNDEKGTLHLGRI
jgi:hypothetical protein